MDLRARRVFRLSLATALSLAAAHALGFTFAFVAPLFAFLLAFRPAPPMGGKALLALLLVVALTTGAGLLLVPMLMHYPLTAVLVIALGLYLSFLLTVHLQQPLLGLFLAMGFALISAAGLANFALGQQLIASLLSGIAIAVVCVWIVYPLFPEDPAPPGTPPPAADDGDTVDTLWLSLRGTLIVLPVTLLALNNPSLYLAAILKSVSLSQQASMVEAARAGRELVGSTFLAAAMAMLFWLLLSILPNLWMFTLLTLLFSLFVAARIYGVVPSRYSPSFWLSAMITMLILVGPAVMDINSGKDVYMAAFVRLTLFVAVTLYAWWMMAFLEMLRRRRQPRRGAVPC